MDEELRRFVVNEVEHQLRPFDAKLSAINLGLERIWNSNGGPPGYLQTRKIEDDDFHDKVNSFIDTAEERQKESEVRQKLREARWNFWWPIIKWAAGGIGTAILALGCWLGPKAVHVTIILAQDYLKYHPEAAQRIQHESQVTIPVSQSQQQDAGETRYIPQ